MNDHDLTHPQSSLKTSGLWPQLLTGVIGMGIVLAGLPAQASESQTPWECSNYSGEAHTRCLEAFVESQRDQIATLQGNMQAQQETVNHLKDQMDRQASSSAELQRQLAQPPAVVQAVPPLYAYPPVGFGLYLGRPWGYGYGGYGYRGYGPPFFYRPYVYGYYGPRHRGHRW
jgi:uncharacterized coiled-coil protein SlyX